MKFWFDECLPPALVKQAHSREYDFVGLCATTTMHTGLIVLPQRGRDAQIALFDRVITYIEERSRQADELPADWMWNRVVEVDEPSERFVAATIPH